MIVYKETPKLTIQLFSATKVFTVEQIITSWIGVMFKFKHRKVKIGLSSIVRSKGECCTQGGISLNLKCPKKSAIKHINTLCELIQNALNIAQNSYIKNILSVNSTTTVANLFTYRRRINNSLVSH